MAGAAHRTILSIPGYFHLPETGKDGTYWDQNAFGCVLQSVTSVRRVFKAPGGFTDAYLLKMLLLLQLFWLDIKSPLRWSKNAPNHETFE